jgi:hypothetical protein
MRPSPAVLCILAVALALRLAFVVATPDYTPRHDDRHYDRLACSIVIAGEYPVRPADADREGCGSMPAGENEPTAFRPPGYPMLLAGVHAAGAPLPVERWTRGRVANALLGTLAVALVGLIAMHFWSRRVALVAMTVLAVDLSLVLVGGSLMSDTLFVALTLGAVLAALRSRSECRTIAWAAGAGALIGLATLTRPTGLLLAIPLGLAVAKRPSRRPAAALVLVVAMALTIAPWTVRNAAMGNSEGLLVALVFAALVMVVTPPLVTMIAERAGFSARTALESGLLLAQTSELSLVLALQGYLVAGQLTQEVFTLVALTTVVTMVLTPWLSSEAVVQRLMRLQPIRKSERSAAPPRDHVLLLGCGSGGMPLLETLFAAGHEVVVIDDDPEVVDRLRRGDVKCIRGDAAEPQTLIEAGAHHALIVSSTIRRPRDNLRLLQIVHRPTVLVRVFEDEDADWVRRLGGTPVVYSAAAAEDFIRWFDRTFREQREVREADATTPALSRVED